MCSRFASLSVKVYLISVPKRLVFRAWRLLLLFLDFIECVPGASLQFDDVVGDLDPYEWFGPL